MEVRYSDEAAEDIQKIADYTIDLWGMDQAIKYRGHFKDAERALKENPFTPLSKPRDNIRRNLRSMKV